MTNKWCSAKDTALQKQTRDITPLAKRDPVAVRRVCLLRTIAMQCHVGEDEKNERKIGGEEKNENLVLNELIRIKLKRWQKLTFRVLAFRRATKAYQNIVARNSHKTQTSGITQTFLSLTVYLPPFGNLLKKQFLALKLLFQPTPLESQVFCSRIQWELAITPHWLKPSGIPTNTLHHRERRSGDKDKKGVTNYTYSKYVIGALRWPTASTQCSNIVGNHFVRQQDGRYLEHHMLGHSE